MSSQNPILRLGLSQQPPSGIGCDPVTPRNGDNCWQVSWHSAQTARTESEATPPSPGEASGISGEPSANPPASSSKLAF
jgi:hypothetical protein